MAIKLSQINDPKLRQRIIDQIEEKGDSVARLRSTGPERNQVQALDGAVKARRNRKGRLVVCCTIVTFRRRILDDDNAAFAAKPIRDAVAAALGLDDGDKRICFQYSQVQTRGRCGTMIVIEEV